MNRELRVMWNPSSRLYKYYNYLDKSILTKSKECMVLPKRNVNDGRIESRLWRSKSGWFSRKGTRPGYPASWPESRIVGVDLNLQVRNGYDINILGKILDTASPNASFGYSVFCCNV